MKRVLFPHGVETLGWLICARCKAHRKEEQVGIVTKRLDGTTALFLPDIANAAVLRSVFGKAGRKVTNTVWIERAVVDLSGDLTGSCHRHGKLEIEVADVLAAIGTGDTPRKRAV